MSKEIGNECIDEAANILGVERAEALDSFGSWMNETFPEMWAEYGNDVLNMDDEDYAHYADMFVLAIRPSGGGAGMGGGKGEEWVGMFIGFDRRQDLMKRKRDMAIDIATADIGVLSATVSPTMATKWVLVVLSPLRAFGALSIPKAHTFRIRSLTTPLHGLSPSMRK